MNNKLLEAVKSAVLALLFAAMTLLAFFSISMNQSMAKEPGVEMPVDSLLILRGGERAAVGLDSAHLLPEFVGFRSEGFTRGSAYSAQTTSGLYGTVSEYLKVIFGSGSVCRRAEDASVWENCRSAEFFVYVKYHLPMPSSVLLAYIAPDVVMDPAKHMSGPEPMVADLFILEGGRCVIRDGRGAVYTVTSEADTDSLSLALRGYESALAPFVFGAGSEKLERLALDGCTVFFTDPLTCPLLTAGTAPVSEDRISDILKLFTFNANRLNTYTESGGQVTAYVETVGTLKLSSDGTMEFTASEVGPECGVAVSDYLGYTSYDGEYSAYDLLKAADSFMTSLGALDRRLVGGDGRLLLTRLYSSESGLTVEFGYTFDGTLVCSPDFSPVTAARFTVRGGRFVSILVKPMTFTAQGNRVRGYGQEWTLSNILRVLDETSPGTALSDGGMSMLCLLPDDASGAGILTPEWIYFHSPAEETETDAVLAEPKLKEVGNELG